MSALLTRCDGCVVIHASEPTLGMRFFQSVMTAVSGEMSEGTRLIVDCSAVTGTDSGGLGSLLGLLRMCEPTREFILAGVPAEITKSLEQAGLTSLFPVFPSVDDALEHVMPVVRLHRAVGRSTTQEETSGLPSSLTRTSRLVPCP